MENDPSRPSWEANGVNAKVAGEFDGLESLMTGLRAGMGVALIGREAVEGGRGKLVAGGLSPAPGPVRVSIGVVADREAGPVVAGFWRKFVGWWGLLRPPRPCQC